MDRDKICSVFIDTTVSDFKDILKVDVFQKNPHLQDSNIIRPDWEISALIDVTGNVGNEQINYGFISLNLKESSGFTIARRLYNKSSNEEISNDDVYDALGELLNIIVGNTRKHLSSSGIKISTPKIIFGKDIKFHNPGKVNKITIIPFEFIRESDIELFDLSISLNSNYF